MDNEAINSNNDERNGEKNNYSLEVVDTIFADTLSRGMQNAIVSQQNSQMASSSSVTNACARILQAQANKSSAIVVPNDSSSKTSLTKGSKSDVNRKIKIEKAGSNSDVKRKPFSGSKVLYMVGAAVLIIAASMIGSVLLCKVSSSASMSTFTSNPNTTHKDSK